MRLTVVGCSGSYPGPDSPASCYLVEHDDDAGRTWRVLLDLGSGALGALQRYADPLAIDAVFLSHLHPDHCADLCGYHVLRRYHPDGPQPRIPVWGPADTAERMAAAYGLPVDPGMTGEFDFRDHAGAVDIGPMTVEAVAVVHPVPAFGIRVRAAGRTLAYSGDTGPCAGLDELADGGRPAARRGVVPHQRRQPARPPPHRRRLRPSGRAGDVGRLVLTHVPPWFDPALAIAEAKEQFAGDIALAVAGAVYDV